MSKVSTTQIIFVFGTIAWLLALTPFISAAVQSAHIPTSGSIVQSAFLTSSSSPSPSLVSQGVTFKGTSLPQQPVLIQYSRDRSIWYNLTGQTDSNGNYTIGWTPTFAGRYYIKASAASAVVNYEHVVANFIVSSIAALRTAVAAGGVVFALAGTYNIYDSIILSSNLLLIGRGDTTIINVPEPRDLSILYGEGVTNVQIMKLKLNGNRQPATTGGNPGIFLRNSRNMIIDSVNIVNLDREAFGLIYSDNITIMNSTAQNVWNGVLMRDSNNIQVKGNWFDWIAGDGIYVSIPNPGVGDENITLIGNTIKNVGDTGIDVSTPYGGTSRNIAIINNTYVSFNPLTPSSQPNGIGITLSRCNNATVSGNTITSAKGGLLIGVNVVKATIDKNIISKFSDYGIWVVTPTNIRQNTLSDSSATGIRINPSAGNFTIEKNVFSNVSISIRWSGNAPRISILDNTILNPSNYGIYDGGTSNFWTGSSIIANNAIKDNRTTHLMKCGIYQGNSAVTWTIRNNTISGATVEAMHLASNTNILG